MRGRDFGAYSGASNRYPCQNLARAGADASRAFSIDATTATGHKAVFAHRGGDKLLHRPAAKCCRRRFAPIFLALGCHILGASPSPFFFFIFIFGLPLEAYGVLSIVIIPRKRGKRSTFVQNSAAYIQCVMPNYVKLGQNVENKCKWAACILWPRRPRLGQSSSPTAGRPGARPRSRPRQRRWSGGQRQSRRWRRRRP